MVLGFLINMVPLLASVLLIMVVIATVMILFSDADLRLMFATKFGKQPETLAGKVVWITGASSGIGEHMALCMAKAGARIVLSARREGELERVKKSCISAGNLADSDVLVVPLDVINYSTHKAAVAQVLEHFSQIDVLVNNAGRCQRAGWTDVDLDVDVELFHTNVLGPVSLTKEVLPHMISRKKGLIAVMSSRAGKVGVPMSRSYTGSKHALNGYFDCLRTEMSEHNIDVTVICPGPVFSNLNLQLATGVAGENQSREMQSHEKRMSTERCAYLSCTAIANRLYEVWMAPNPILIMDYCSLYLPDFGKWMTNKIGLERLMKMREGK